MFGVDEFDDMVECDVFVVFVYWCFVGWGE